MVRQPTATDRTPKSSRSADIDILLTQDALRAQIAPMLSCLRYPAEVKHRSPGQAIASRASDRAALGCRPHPSSAEQQLAPSLLTPPRPKSFTRHFGLARDLTCLLASSARHSHLTQQCDLDLCAVWHIFDLLGHVAREREKFDMRNHAQVVFFICAAKNGRKF